MISMLSSNNQHGGVMITKTSKIAELAIYTAVAFIFSYIESLFPLPIPFPGIKRGLANLVILIVLHRSGLAAAPAATNAAPLRKDLLFMQIQIYKKSRGA